MPACRIASIRVLLLILPLFTACAHIRTSRAVDTQPQYELTTAAPDADVPVVRSDEVVATLPLEDVTAEEAAAFKAEAVRLVDHPDPNCRRLGDAMQAHLAGLRMYENALVRYVGPYKFYGVGHSYQSDGDWKIRIARRLNDLNPRTLDEETGTLRHEMSHTLGARERRVGEEWSARDYADRCA